MRKILTVLMVVTVAAGMVLARAPIAQQPGATPDWSPLTTETPSNSDELAIPVQFMPEGSEFSGRPGFNPLDVVDSSLSIDDFEGGFPAWISADLAAGIFWHPDTSRALGGSGTSWWCGAPEIPGYNNHWLQHLILPAFDLSSSPAPMLAFKARWSIEDPGVSGDYNMWDTWNIWGSTDGGVTWFVLEPSAPNDPFWGDPPSTNYSQTSSYAFGEEWGMGPNIPGYGGQSDFALDYNTVTVPLTPLIGAADARVRISFCSDPAFCSIDDPTYFGLHVDSIRVTDGALATTLYSNDGTSDGMITLSAGPESPDTWVYDTDTYHSATHSWNAEQTAYNVQRAIYSYPVTLPAGYQKLKLNYWVWCDLPDYDGSGDNSLEDYYAIYVSTNNGVIWTQVVYDYGYDNGEAAPGGNSLDGWVQRTRGLTSGGSQSLDIPLFSGDGSAPHTVRIAVEVKLDGDDNGGSGTGLHVDDMNFIAQRAQAIDLATRNMVIPLPTTVGIVRPWTFDFVNEGLNGISPVRGWQRYYLPDGSQIPPGGTDSLVLSSGVLNYGESRTVTRILTPSMKGAWRFRIIANAPGELDRTNDTTYSPATNTNPDRTLGVFVQPAGVYELGYNRRAVANAYLQQRFIHFTPLADGVPGGDAANFDLLQLRIMWRYDSSWVNGATTEIKFWEEGVDSFHTGPMIYSFTTDIDSSETIGAQGIVRWWTQELTSVPALHNLSGNFWVSVAALDTLGEDPSPLPLGMSPAGAAPDGHNYYGTDGGALTQSAGRVLVDAVIGQAVEDLTVHRGPALANDVVLDWTAPPGASKYYVWRLATPNQVYTTGTLLTPGGITTNTYTDLGAVSMLKNFYVVIAEY